MKKLIAFDMDDTLTVTKSPISDENAALLSKLLEKYRVCVISGGSIEQFKLQILDHLSLDHDKLSRLHLMPTCGTTYFEYSTVDHDWFKVYENKLTKSEKLEIVSALEKAAKNVDLWCEDPKGEIIEDRSSQITLSALGQEQEAEIKKAWDPDGSKKMAIRDEAAKLLPDFEVRTGGTTSIDVTYPGIDKAYGMKKLIEELSISADEILFVGDMLHEGGNDYPVKAMGIDCVEVENPEDTSIVMDTAIKIAK